MQVPNPLYRIFVPYDYLSKTQQVSHLGGLLVSGYISKIILTKLSSYLSLSPRSRISLLIIALWGSYYSANVLSRGAFWLLGENTSSNSKDKQPASSHNGSSWAKKFNNATHSKQTMLKELFQQTKQACFNGWSSGSLNPEAISRMQEGTHVISQLKPLEANEKAKAVTSTSVEVVNKDCLDYGLELRAKGYNPVILNMADSEVPGGLVEKGNQAQEEELFRRTNYFQALYPQLNNTLRGQIGIALNYFIPSKGAIYTPQVQVFRNNQANGYSFLNAKDVRQLSFIASAAPDLSRFWHSDFLIKIWSKQKYENRTKEKIRTILRLAFMKGHDSVVLSAYGCGVFQNDPEDMAAMFKQVLQSPEFKRKFKKISFAILDTKGSKNFEKFKKALHGLTITKD